MSKTQLMESTYLFRGVAAGDISALAAVAEQTTLFQGQTVYGVDQQSDALFIIEVGTVDIIVKGKQTPVVTMGTGQTLDYWLGLRSSHPLSGAIRASASAGPQVPGS